MVRWLHRDEEYAGRVKDKDEQYVVWHAISGLHEKLGNFEAARSALQGRENSQQRMVVHDIAMSENIAGALRFAKTIENRYDRSLAFSFIVSIQVEIHDFAAATKIVQSTKNLEVISATWRRIVKNKQKLENMMLH